MAKLRLTAAALNDLDEIREHGVEAFGPLASARYLEGFGRKFALLRAQPRAGQVRPEFRRDMRSLPYRPYRILYEVAGDTVVIARIIHQSRDVRRALRELQ
jgi:toxin ParE1/3/4